MPPLPPAVCGGEGDAAEVLLPPAVCGGDVKVLRRHWIQGCWNHRWIRLDPADLPDPVEVTVSYRHNLNDVCWKR